MITSTSKMRKECVKHLKDWAGKKWQYKHVETYERGTNPCHSMGQDYE